MKAGLLNTRIEIRHKTAVEDAVGATVHRWQSLVNLWANVRHLSGSESIKGDQLTSNVRASVRIRYRRDIHAGMQLIAGGIVYEIQAVLPDLQRRVFVDLVCEGRGDAAD